MIALVLASFFVFGIHEMESHFCPLFAASGVCGFLGGLDNLTNHILALSTLAAFLFSAFVGLLLSGFLFKTVFPKENISWEFSGPPIILAAERTRWLTRLLNSPNSI